MKDNKWEEKMEGTQGIVTLEGVNHYNTSTEENYQIEFDFQYVKEAFQDFDMDKSTFESQYIFDDTEYLLNWLTDNDKEFILKTLAK